MADNDHEARFRQHEAILESLARMLAAQHEMNRQQVEINLWGSDSPKLASLNPEVCKSLICRAKTPSDTSQLAARSFHCRRENHAGPN